MKKNGFTLIELLAVIVILAIIALIATPIILGIINDAREKANERSVELYAAAVKNAIAAYQLTNANAPTSFSDLNVQYDGKVECTVEELYSDGSFYLEGCKVNGNEKEYSYGEKQGSSMEAGKMSICNPLYIQTEGKYTPGDKYECDVDPEKLGYDQIFYVLNASTTEVNLIMDSNIRIGGEAVKETNPTEEQKGTIAWYADEVNNSYGPITALEYLQSATSGWTNTNLQTISTFTDDIGETHQMAKTYTMNARMPYLSEVDYTYETNEYLYEYLSVINWEGIGTQPTNKVSGVYGYWTVSSRSDDEGIAMTVECNGLCAVSDVQAVYTDDYLGVRPVINLSI